MKKKSSKIALAAMLTLLVVGMAAGVHLTHKDAYALSTYHVYIHSGDSPMTGLQEVTFFWSLNGVVVDQGPGAETPSGYYTCSTNKAPLVEFDHWRVLIGPDDIERFGIVPVDPDSNPIPNQVPGTSTVDWSVAPDQR